MSETDAVNPAGEVTSTSQETPTDVTAVKPEAEATSQPQGEKTDPPKKEGGVAKRIKELVEERNAWREQARRNQGITQEDRKEVSQGKPEAAKFESYEAYLDALADWKVEQRLAERDQKSKEETSKRERVERLQKAREGFEDRAEKFREAHDDFDEVAFDDAVPVSEAMAEAIFDSELGPELLYHLGQNQKEAARISRLSPFAAAREIGKLEVQLKTPAPKRPSNAPEPITPVGGKEKVVTDMEKIPISEWMQRRKEQLRKKA